MIDLRFSVSRRAVLLIAVSAAAPLCGRAQAVSAGSRTSKLDFYGGYSYFRPVNSDIYNVEYQPISLGGVASATAYFGKHFGIQGEGSFFPGGPNDSVSSAQGGAVFRFSMGRFVPFAHFLAGEAKVSGPVVQPSTGGFGATGGIGGDYVLLDHIAIRLFQADFAYSQVNYGPRHYPVLDGGLGQITAMRLSMGLVFTFWRGETGAASGPGPRASSHPGHGKNTTAGNEQARDNGIAPAAPSAALPPAVPANYVIGADDSIQVTVWKEPNLSATLPVRPDGKITLPLLGDVQAAGFTPMRLATYITARLKEYVTDPVVDVSVLGVHGKRVFLMGQVLNPGPVALTAGMTVLQAIAGGGGLAPYADKKHMYILREGKKIPFDYTRALKKGDMQGVSLEPGDTIVAP
jgi:polysaccharide biosynthesis/export protein